MATDTLSVPLEIYKRYYATWKAIIVFLLRPSTKWRSFNELYLLSAVY